MVFLILLGLVLVYSLWFLYQRYFTVSGEYTRALEYLDSLATLPFSFDNNSDDISKAGTKYLGALEFEDVVAFCKFAERVILVNNFHGIYILNIYKKSRYPVYIRIDTPDRVIWCSELLKNKYMLHQLSRYIMTSSTEV